MQGDSCIDNPQALFKQRRVISQEGKQLIPIYPWERSQRGNKSRLRLPCLDWLGRSPSRLPPGIRFPDCLGQKKVRNILQSPAQPLSGLRTVQGRYPSTCSILIVQVLTSAAGINPGCHLPIGFSCSSITES
jgi:hypothetical protein